MHTHSLCLFETQSLFLHITNYQMIYCLFVWLLSGVLSMLPKKTPVLLKMGST